MLRMFTHSQLVARGAKWLYTRGCSAVIAEPGAHGGESPDVIGWLRARVSIVIEVKVSVSDYDHDHEKPHRKPGMGAGQTRYYLTPKGLLKNRTVPEDWGLLEALPSIIRVVKPAPPRRVLDPKIALREVPYLTSELWKHHFGTSYGYPVKKHLAPLPEAALVIKGAELRANLWEAEYRILTAATPEEVLFWERKACDITEELNNLPV